jgi:hypothetical protein
MKYFNFTDTPVGRIYTVAFRSVDLIGPIVLVAFFASVMVLK